MTAPWRARAVESVELAGPRELTGSEAQQWCNFVLFAPRWLPADCAIARASLRPEAPPGRVAGDAAPRAAWTASNRAAHRLDVAGRGRALRIKQFFYDYAPPAFDHPSLWESPRVEPFAAGAQIAWLGTDFQKHRAAALIAERTTIEIGVQQGAFRDDELRRIVRALEPVSAEARQAIGRTSSAALAYQSRYDETAIAVPVGYWAHKRGEHLRCRAVACAPADRPPVDVTALERRGYTPESRYLFFDGGVETEQDWVFRHEDDAGQAIRLLLSRDGTRGGVPWPPARELRQPCSVTAFAAGTCDVHHAFADPELGQHEIVWQAGGWTRMLLVKPGVWTTAAWFRSLAEDLVRSSGVSPCSTRHPPGEEMQD